MKRLTMFLFTLLFLTSPVYSGTTLKDIFSRVGSDNTVGRCEIDTSIYWDQGYRNIYVLNHFTEVDHNYYDIIHVNISTAHDYYVNINTHGIETYSSNIVKNIGWSSFDPKYPEDAWGWLDEMEWENLVENQVLLLPYIGFCTSLSSRKKDFVITTRGEVCSKDYIDCYCTIGGSAHYNCYCNPFNHPIDIYNITVRNLDGSLFVQTDTTTNLVALCITIATKTDAFDWWSDGSSYKWYKRITSGERSLEWFNIKEAKKNEYIVPYSFNSNLRLVETIRLYNGSPYPLTMRIER